jgi:hypothetical protein
MLDEVTPALLCIVVLVVGLIVVHGLFTANFVIDGITIGLVSVLLVVVLVPILESATLPGGAGVRFRKRQLDELQREAVEAVSKVASAPAAQDSADSMVSAPDGGADQAQSYATTVRAWGVDRAELVARILDETGRSPKIGLMVLASELERATRQLLAATGWITPESSTSLRAGIRRLVELDVVPPAVRSAVDLFASIRNEVVHGRQRFTDDDILRAVDAGLDILNAIYAVPRERHTVAAVNVPVFRDEKLTERIEDATGVILQSVTPGALNPPLRIYPTTQTHFQIGREVAWEWNPARQWGPAWYVDEEAGVRPAWTGSMEFVGRDLEDV